MANPFAGEVGLTIDGEVHTLKLTLGALAELEAQLKADSLMAVVERFESGGFTTRDVSALLIAGLRGGGAALSAEALLKADIEGGPVAAAQAAGELLARAFTVPESA
ncbi:gene transfer agent family protein [Poseidonocella sedimentorum]|uniref:Phage tail tube protein, GTA-gp10 n=1 Tax=Poseidonocella sedimentorum TaxID=871652 RepID=A0A1I6DH77_9RHOB|nr:gene transfer agent family protein [Poseidonocella sedimentorum]SFR04747.1 Phage tail tube protein, GTA-gp10 [Poseidonocella sedimentorum]